jgi:hypothetical protein
MIEVCTDWGIAIVSMPANVIAVIILLVVLASIIAYLEPAKGHQAMIWLVQIAYVVVFTHNMVRAIHYYAMNGTNYTYIGP